MYQILAKSNNPRLSYSDLNTEYLGADPNHGFYNHCTTCAGPQPTHIPNSSKIEQSTAVMAI